MKTNSLELAVKSFIPSKPGYMWIGGDALMLLACIPIAVVWVKWETVRTRELDAELDAKGL